MSPAQPSARARTPLPMGTWKVDPAHSSVGFRVKHLGVATVKGRFEEFEGTLEVGEEAAQAHGTVQVDSIDTGDAHRDANLRSPDLFDAELHPRIAFRSSAIRPLDGDAFEIVGELELHGVTKPLALHATLTDDGPNPDGRARVGVSASAKISRSEHELRFGGALRSGNAVVADRVEILLEISAVQASR